VEWVLLLADVVLVGVLVRIWSSYQTHANELKRRWQAALQRAAEHQQRIEATRKEIAAEAAQLPEIEALAKTLKGDLTRAEERLAKLEMIEGEQE
jgi:chromosome segregation ATPase